MTVINMPLTFKQAQTLVDQWIAQFEEGYFPPLVQLARLSEELGELSRALSHELGVKKPKKNEPDANVDEEIGDLLLVLTCLANARGADLETIFQKTLDKIQTRDTSRWTLKHRD